MTSVAEPQAELQNIGQRLLQRAGTEGVITFHDESGALRLDIDELLARAAACATRLQDRGIGAGDAVGVLGPNRPEWVSWALGAWLAGAALVPLPAPVRVRDADAYALQIRSLVEGVGCTLTVAHPRYLSAVPDDRAMDWEMPTPGVSDLPDDVDAALDDTAMILCTSGSTSAPKGIRLTNATMLARTARRRSFGLRALTWLPLYHAAGMLALSGPVWSGSEYNLMLAEEFARDPASWFRKTTELEAQIIGGASSAFAAAVRAIARRPEGIELSCVQSTLFALEMVDPDVLDQLVEVCGPLGLRPETFSSSYGQSEGGGTLTPLGQGIRVDTVDLEELVSSGRAVPAHGSRPAKRVASCGSCTPPTELLIGKPDEPLPERHVGAIFFGGRAFNDGYVRRDAESPYQDGWLRTGDLGYVAEGELFVTGRSKELIVHFGRNYHPEDIEWAALRVSGVLPGSCVAFADPSGEEGAVIVVVESDLGDDLRNRVRLGVTNAVGLTPRDVVIVDSGTIPKAANGKIQRLAARDAYGRGDLWR